MIGISLSSSFVSFLKILKNSNPSIATQITANEVLVKTDSVINSNDKVKYLILPSLHRYFK